MLSHKANRSMAQALGDLKKAGYRKRSVKEEMRENVIAMLRKGESPFPDIVGYEETVLPGIVNALLSKHDFILLGLRGQAKTRILRSLTRFLDEYIPILAGTELNDDPFDPVSARGRRIVSESGDRAEISWLHRTERYREKLATPDVTISDLIGDVDPVKAATKRLTYSDEEVIHYGIIPRTNRGIFAINEIPDLPSRIQVGLLNILEEEDIQIRGFPVRIPLDILMVFSANPEDYTNRGSIITPLKDRIDSQICTHYPRTVEEAIRITEQEAWTRRDGDYRLTVPPYFQELIELVAFAARDSEYIDQKSGVSARVSITLTENVLSNMERRAIVHAEKNVYPRIGDLHVAVTAITGKIELVYEGEQEGPEKVARKMVGEGVKDLFRRHLPPADSKKAMKRVRGEDVEPTPYQQILTWFSKGNSVETSDNLNYGEYFTRLDAVRGLQAFARKHLGIEEHEELGLGMEIILEGLHQQSMLSKREAGSVIAYRDMLKAMFERMSHNKN